MDRFVECLFIDDEGNGPGRRNGITLIDDGVVVPCGTADIRNETKIGQCTDMDL